MSFFFSSSSSTTTTSDNDDQDNNNNNRNNNDPYPMTSPEAYALEASINLNYSDNSSTTEHSNSSYENYNEEEEEDCEVVWTSMETQSSWTGTTSNSGSASVLARIRGGGGSAAKESLVKTTTNNNNNNPSVAAVMEIGLEHEEGTNNDDDDEDDGDHYTNHTTKKHNNNNNDDDLFFDRPIYESRAKKGYQRTMVSIERYLEKIVHRLYGNELPITEFVRILTLSTTLFCTIGGYWLMRSLKDPVIAAICGVTVIPKAKMVSVFVVLGIVSVYNHLLDTDIPKHKLFYVFGTFYFVLFATIAALLTHPTYGLANEIPDPNRILGWVSYCSIESFGSIMVALFWSFTNSNIHLQTAKSCYGLMVGFAQVGSILGPTFVQFAAPKIGVSICYFIGACTMLVLQFTMYLYIRIYGVQSRGGLNGTFTKEVVTTNNNKTKTKKEKPGITEGLKLFYHHNYVKGIFAISCLYMVEETIIDYTMKVLARDYFANEYSCEYGMSCYNVDDINNHGMSQDATTAFTSFMGFFGQSTNLLSFLLSFFGTSAVIRYLGLRITLLLFPSLLLCVIIFVRFYPTLMVLFGAMLMLKASSYAFNNPTKEILYQPTSPAVKYKAKSWIDIFGARGSKALGSIVTNAFSDSTPTLVANGSFVCMILASFLIWNATYMGKLFDTYMSTGYIVGSSSCADSADASSSESINLNMAMKQNEKTNTSCAIYENDDEIGPEEEGQSESSDGSEDNEDFAKKPDVVMV